MTTFLVMVWTALISVGAFAAGHRKGWADCLLFLSNHGKKLKREHYKERF